MCSLDAVDFILKPATTERLAKTIAKVCRAQQQGRVGAEDTPNDTRYPVVAGNGMVLMDLAKTAFFEVEDQVVWAFVGERFRTKWKTLGEVEAFFPDTDLIRIHRHPLVRPASILGLRSSGNGNRVLVRMVGGIELEASRGATPELKRRLRLG